MKKTVPVAAGLFKESSKGLKEGSLKEVELETEAERNEVSSTQSVSLTLPLNGPVIPNSLPIPLLTQLPE